ncbi:hypothetical protein B0I35DRAFT_457622 [Stachybotrys elegans]|uniref:Cytochrome b561 domain-containing protein n=1 Tax=Stachybotrys elegans TaxID=80388 RepID=A0A8K0T590_9HYPO|nr:hypothetical protein B0I35DRAFT_457622 [Stachybotrys elegans]
MAPAPNEFSAPGSVSYDSNTMVVGDGTWDFERNTFLLPNLVSPNLETMRYNGMGNRFSTFGQYHILIRAHAVMAVIVFLFLLPTSVMIARFYTNRPGWAIRYHAQLNILSGLLLLAVFILGFFAVGPERALTNPHHGIGVAIFVLFVLQIVGGRLVRHITKSRSLRLMLHQWSGRAVVLLGMAQVPLGLTLYGSPLYLFIMYAVWMALLVLVYFILSYRSESRREFFMSGARSEGGRTGVTETEYLESEHNKPSGGGGGWAKWLGPAAAGAGAFALLRGRKKDRDGQRGRSVSRSRSRGPEVIPSRRGSTSFVEDEKYSELPPAKKSSGGGVMRTVGGFAAALGVGKLVSGFMNRRERQREEEYSAVSTETPRRHRPTRGAMTASEYGTEMTGDYGPGGTETDYLPPSANPPAMAHAMSAADSRYGPRRPVTPTRNRSYRNAPSGIEESEYSSYVSPSRRHVEERQGGGGAGKGILAALGMGWLAKRLADRRARREEERMRDDEDMRSGTMASRYTGDVHSSPSRRASRRPPPRKRPGIMTESALSDLTESSIETRPVGESYTAGPSTLGTSIHPGAAPAPPSGSHSRSRSGSRHHVAMPPMPADPRGVLRPQSDISSLMSSEIPPQRGGSSQHRTAVEREAAAAAAAARASSLATDEDRLHRAERERYGSPGSQAVSLKLKVHDDKDRNVTLRRLTEEEAMAEKGRADDNSSISGIDSPSNRHRYRRSSSQRRPEVMPEPEPKPVDEDMLPPLSPPNPAYARGRRGKDSAYYSGQPGPSGMTPMAGQTVSSLGSHGTWSGMSPSPSANVDPSVASHAADNRRRRRQERRRGSSATTRPSGPDMFD